MTSPSSNIVVLSSGLLSAYGLDPEALAKEINGWDNVAGTRLVQQWTLEQIGEIAPGHRFFLVGRGEPVPGLDARWFPVDLAVQMPWLGGDPKENVKALIWAALAEVDLEPDLERVSIEPYSQVLVMGQGPAAKDTVLRLAQAGVKVVWAVPNGASGRLEVTAPPGVQILPCLGLSGLTGFAGRFTAALDKAKPGDRLLLASFGSGAGSDAFSFIVTDKIDKVHGRAPSTLSYVHREEKIDYARYARWRKKIVMY